MNEPRSTNCRRPRMSGPRSSPASSHKCTVRRWLCKMSLTVAVLSSASVGLAFAPSIDGTNYATYTNQWLFALIEPKGATRSVSWTNFPAHLLDNARTIKLVMITNNNCATSCWSWVSNLYIGTR